MTEKRENGEFPKKENLPEDRDINSLYERMERLSGRAIPSPLSNFDILIK